jgi:hypothetical protein
MYVPGIIQTEESRQNTEDSRQQIEYSRQHHVPEQKIELVELERPACMGHVVYTTRQIIEGGDVSCFSAMKEDRAQLREKES